MQNLNIAINVYSIIVCVIPVMYLLPDRRHRVRLNRLFMYMCLSNVVMLAGDLTDWVCRGNSQAWFPAAYHIGMFLFFAAACPLMYAFASYIIEYLSDSVKVHAAFKRTALVLSAAHLVLVIKSQFNDMFYSIGPDNIYVRGEWFWLSQIIPAAIYLISVAMLVIYRKSQRPNDFARLFIYMTLPTLAQLIQVHNYGIALVNAAMTVTLLLIFINIQSRREMLIKQQEKELAEGRISIMLSQIKPHFLYNALTAIHKLCDIDPEMAKESIVDFSCFLRANMDSLTNKLPIPFERELSHTRHYLKLEQQRFLDRLNVKTDLRAMDFSIPPLTLEPLAENAVRHGILMREKGGTLTIVTDETKSVYIVRVIDDGVGFDPDAQITDEHVGIKNVRERLLAMCGGTLNIQSAPGAGTVATIILPKERKA